MIGWIITLIIIGIILFVVELVLLPGITIAAIGSFCCLISAVYLSFTYESSLFAWIVLALSIILIIVATVTFLKSATWKKFELKDKISDTPDLHKATVGDTGKALTRLAPMGKVLINGEVIEAKTMGGYIDENSEIEVIGTENSNIIVKIK